VKIPRQVGSATRLSRRDVLRGGAWLAAASATAAALGCGDRLGGARTPAATPTVTSAPISPHRGGVLRLYNFDALPPETLDPHLVRDGSIGSVHSAIFSRLLQYEDEVTGSIVPDLADGLPEQPDELTYIFKLRRGARFHDSPLVRLAVPALAGREVAASDVRFSLERQLAADDEKPSRFPRRGQLEGIDRIDVIDAATIRIILKDPIAPFLAFMAGRHAFVVPSEWGDTLQGQTLSLAALAGTGPFMLESFEPGLAAKLRRNPDWFAREEGGSGPRPYLDGYHAFLSPQQDEFQREALERGFVDATEFLDPAALEHAHATNLTDILLEERDAGGVLASRFLADRPPFQDDRTRRALHLAVDRTALLALLYPEIGGKASARLAGPMPPALTRWAIADEDLRRTPGYIDDRAAAITEARQLWTASRGDAQVSELHLHCAGTPRTLYEQAVPAIQRQLGDALGVTVTAQADPSGDALIKAGLRLNADGATEGTLAWTFGFEDAGVDLDDSLYASFRSGEPGNTFRLQDATLDRLLEAQRREFDPDVRRELGVDIQEYLLANVNARLEFLAPVRRRLTWSYVRNPHLPLWGGSDQLLARTWLDTSDPAWARRRA
jgi:ABC-type transport system substrate-binding protein